MPLTVVTGGTRGIGAAVAHRLAADGHDLVLGFRSDVDAAENLAQTLHGVDVDLVRMDVGHDDGIQALFEAAGSRPITGLVANAGATEHIGDLADTPVGTIRSVIDANLVGAVLVCRRAVTAMSTRRGGAGGSIVTISSVAAATGSPHEYVHYAAAKAGVEAMTVGLAKEVAEEGIRVNCVAPGMVETRIHADAGESDRLERVVGRIPFGRVGQPDEIASAVAHLLSSEASYTSGAILRVAGGL